MANRYAVQDGDWSDTATWDGGTLPAVGDTVRPNNYTVTIDVDVTVDSIRSDASAPASATGNFVVNDGVTVNVTTEIVSGNTTASDGLFEPASGAEINIICPIICGECFQVTTGTTTNVTGNGDTVGSNSAGAIFRMSRGTMNWNGNLNTTTGGYISDFVSGGTMNVIGNISGSGKGFWTRGSASVTITGNCSVEELYNTTQTSYPALTIIGEISAGGSNPCIRSRSPIIASGPFINNGNIMAVSADRMTLIDGTTQWDFVDESANTFPLYSAASAGTGQAAESDVKLGVVYGPSDELTGTYDPAVVDVAQLAVDFLDEIQTSSHVVAQRLRAAATDDSVGNIVSSTLSA